MSYVVQEEPGIKVYIHFLSLKTCSAWALDRSPLRGISMAYPVTNTRLCNFDPLKPHFYIVKLGFTGVYITFFFAKRDCGYSLEPPCRGGSKEYLLSMF